ncbi:MAG TPA: phosphoribosyltransferase family protein [Jiangellales bacterium]|nr:phosphoribosyltransferase family protein [Jiangellales bacterium]
MRDHFRPWWPDRRAAGRELGEALAERGYGPECTVLGLPRGGVVVAAEVARVLGAPLDALVVRKAGVPWQPELALGAAGAGGVRVLNVTVAERAGLGRAQCEAALDRAAAEAARREAVLRPGRPQPVQEGSEVLLVDDGLATGATARAALRVARHAGAARVVLAVPVAPAGTSETFRDEADDVVVLAEPHGFGSVGAFYGNFDQVEDAEVVRLLSGA